MRFRSLRAAAVGAALGTAATLLLTGGRAPAGQEPAPEASYVLADYGGRVAVYCPAEGAVPREVTSIRVELLPAADREQLRRGIGAAGPAELAMLLEDLSC